MVAQVASPPASSIRTISVGHGGFGAKDFGYSLPATGHDGGPYVKYSILCPIIQGVFSALCVSYSTVFLQMK